MPQVKTKASSKPGKSSVSAGPGFQYRTTADVHELISKMLEYEDTAKAQGLDLASGRFKMLTNSERQFHRAELIADYIRLSVGSLGNTPGYFDATLESFCSKICDMEIPSLELMGTYLAATDISEQEERLKSIPTFQDAVRRAMMSVLQTCVEKLRVKSEERKRIRLPKAA